MKKTQCFCRPSWPDVDLSRLLLPVKFILLLLIFISVSQPVLSSGIDEDQQQFKVTGTVTDAATGQPLPGVNVTIKGTTIGAITDAQGKYSMTFENKDAILTFSFIGFIIQEVSIAGKAIVDVTLAEQVTGLDEVVVVGYGTQKRANVIGSVTSLPGATIQSIPAASITNALSGRLPGSVVIQQNGEPGNLGARILIRGRTNLGSSTYPLVVIDGVPGRSMDEIDPMDVSSLSVLKDASAAIYGASAANGVILITTKKGQEGRPRLNYQFFQGFMTPTRIPEVCNAEEYATMLSEFQVQNGKTRTYSDADIALYKSGADPWKHPDSDWYGDLIKDWTTTYRHNLSIDGGAKGMNYYISIGLKGDEAMYKQSSTSYKQYNVRAKVDLPITDWLKTGIEVAGFEIQRLYPYKSADAIVGQSTRLTPTTWSFWPNGKPGPDIEYGDNPVVTSTFEAGKNDQNTYRLLTTFNATITIPWVEGLTVNGTYNYDLTHYYNKAFYQPWILYYPNWTQATIDPVTGFVTDMPLTPTLRGLSSPQNNERYDRTKNVTANIGINYARKFGDHNIALFGGYEQSTYDYNNFTGFRQYYISAGIQTMNAGANLDKNTTGSASIHARKSYILRASYDYQGKYLAEFLFRRDGSLRYAPDLRWGNFPAILLGWRASEENFWQDNISFINFFKLRATYGKMGFDTGNPFQYTPQYPITSGMVFGTGTTIETAVGPPTIPNPNITWESETSYNAGFDSKFLNDLFHLNFDIFYRKREDLLTARDASVPGFSGLSLPQENIGVVDNRGFEVEGGVHKTIGGGVRIDLGGNFSWNRNEVVFADEPARSVPWQVRTGHPYNSQLWYNVIGVFADQAAIDAYAHWATAKPGDLIFEDVSGDGTITGDDRILFDNTDAPEIFYGANLDVSWKSFTLSVLLQGQGKYIRSWAYDERRGEAGNYFKWTFDNRWTPANTITDVPRAFNRNDYYWAHAVNMSNYWTDNVAYCRLKTLVLTYNIPKKVFGKLGISNASVYVSGNNLALLYSATKKYDPEVDSPGVYPAMKTFAFGANVTF